MNLLTIRMDVLAEKRIEFMQTIVSLVDAMKMEKGCARCYCCQNIEDENELILMQEWDTQADFEGYRKSGPFKILEGSLILLAKSHEMTFHQILRPGKS